MVVIVEPMWVHKMGIGTTDLCRPGIHHIHKAIDGSCDILCDSIRRIIGRFQHQCVQRLAQCHFFSWLDPAVGTGVFNIIDNF